MAQGGWKARYFLNNSNSTVAYQSLESPSGDFLVLGQTYDAIKKAYLLSVLGTDNAGKLKWRKDYGGELNYLTDIVAPRCLIQDGQNFYRATWIWDSVNGYGSAFIKFSYNGDTIWQKRFYSSEPKVLLYFFACAKSCDGGFLITGIFEDFNLHVRSIALLKLDKNGDEIFRKKILKASNPSNHCGQAIIQDSATKKIIVTGSQYIENGSLVESYSNVVFCDSLGNLINQKTYNNGGGGTFAEVIKLRDKNFLTCGAWKAYDDSGGNTFYKSMVVKFDIDGNKIWSKIYEPAFRMNRINYLYELPSGDIIMQGMIDSAAVNMSDIRPYKPQIIRTDKNGNIKWTRGVGHAYIDEDSTYLYDYEICRSFNPTADGGYVLSGNYYIGSSPGYFMVTKVDSNACDTDEAYCRSVVLDLGNSYQLKGFEFNLFPNPARDAVTLKIEGELRFFHLTITDLLGRFLLDSKIKTASTVIDLTSFSEGTYFVSLCHNGQAIETKKLVIVR